MEARTAPWQKPWEPGTTHLPYPSLGAVVQGLEHHVAGDAEGGTWLTSGRWITYKQAQSVGAQVRRGEKGTLVQYWKLTDQIAVKDKRGKSLKDGEGNTVYRTVQLDKPKVFSAVVFNAEQIEGLPPLQHRFPSGAPDWDRHERAEVVLRG